MAELDSNTGLCSTSRACDLDHKDVHGGHEALLAVYLVGEGGAHGKRSMDLLGAGKKEFLSYLTFLSLSLQERHLGPRCFCPGWRGGVPNQSRE